MIIRNVVDEIRNFIFNCLHLYVLLWFTRFREGKGRISMVRFLGPETKNDVVFFSFSDVEAKDVFKVE